MTQEYLRQLSLIVANNTGNGFDFGNFWCTFNVRRGDIQTPNSLDARIYNVSNNTANKISQKEFTTISLSAGYPGNVGLIFQGNICQFRQGRQNQLDSYVDITAADSDRAYNFATISTTAPAGSTPSALASLIQSALNAKAGPQGVALAPFQPTFPASNLVRGRCMYGMARDEMRDFAWANNCKASIQDGELTFIPYTAFIPGGQVPVISVETGLIGVPEQTQAGINIRILLNPSIKIGQLIRLNSQINQFRFGLDIPSQQTNPAIALQNQLAPNEGDQQGLYYVMVVNHNGDTRGQNWYTDLTCLAVDATLVQATAASQLFATGPVPIQRYGGT